jgi:2'-5' RNA ligase
MRAFIALEFKTKEKEKIFSVFKEKVLFEGIGKEVEKENYHLTFFFFPNLNEIELEILKNEVKKIKEELNNLFERKVLKIKGVSAFPNLRKARVLFLEVSEDDRLNKIFKKLKRTILKNKIESKFKEPFKPHITLMRIKKLNYLKIKNFEDFELEFENISLFKSTLTRKGPIYEKII